MQLRPRSKLQVFLHHLVGVEAGLDLEAATPGLLEDVHNLLLEEVLIPQPQ